MDDVPLNFPADAHAASTRRSLLLRAAGVGAALILAGARTAHADEPEGMVTATEDLMREHGILRRVLIVYSEAAAKQQFEEIEHRQFGEDGFEEALDAIARVESSLGVASLTAFTAAPPPR